MPVCVIGHLFWLTCMVSCNVPCVLVHVKLLVVGLILDRMTPLSAPIEVASIHVSHKFSFMLNAHNDAHC